MSAPKDRVTVSLDAGVAKALKDAARQAGSASVSQYVEDAVAARIKRDQWLARWRAEAGEADPEALAYARRVLLGERAGQPRAS